MAKAITRSAMALGDFKNSFLRPMKRVFSCSTVFGLAAAHHVCKGGLFSGPRAVQSDLVSTAQQCWWNRLHWGQINTKRVIFLNQIQSEIRKNQSVHPSKCHKLVAPRATNLTLGLGFAYQNPRTKTNMKASKAIRLLDWVQSQVFTRKITKSRT